MRFYLALPLLTLAFASAIARPSPMRGMSAFKEALESTSPGLLHPSAGKPPLDAGQRALESSLLSSHHTQPETHHYYANVHQGIAADLKAEEAAMRAEHAKVSAQPVKGALTAAFRWNELTWRQNVKSEQKRLANAIEDSGKLQAQHLSEAKRHTDRGNLAQQQARAAQHQQDYLRAKPMEGSYARRPLPPMTPEERQVFTRMTHPVFPAPKSVVQHWLNRTAQSRAAGAPPYAQEHGARM